MQHRKGRLEDLTKKAADKARSQGRGILVSLSDRIEHVDALGMLESMDPALVPDRMFWAIPREDFALAAAGSVWMSDEGGPHRFSDVNRELRSLIDNSVSDGQGEKPRGVGPLLVGGFSFESDGPRTETWSGFGSSRVFLPSVLVTSVNGETWLTLNTIVDADGRANPSVGSLVQFADSVTETSSLTFSAEAPARDDVIFADTGARIFPSLVSDAVAEIKRGSFDKVVLARCVRASTESDIDAFSAVRHLLAVHRNAFVFGVWNGEKVFLGASPELLARQDGQTVYASSLAGTIERGASREDDEANAASLRSSAKDLAEHAAVRNELYEALSETCDDVSAPEQPALLSLTNVHHLHTPLSARLRENGSLLDIVERLHPTPAVGGAPRDAALKFIREHEQLDRGWYAAPVGWIAQRSGEFAVALRSALVQADEAMLYAGCGIVRDSDPDSELEESNLKLKAMKEALAASLTSETRSPIKLGSAAEKAD